MKRLRGELEAQVMDVLWDADGWRTPSDGERRDFDATPRARVYDGDDDSRTVHEKGIVQRRQSGRGICAAADGVRDEYAAERMREMLDASGDGLQTLARFVDAMSTRRSRSSCDARWPTNETIDRAHHCARGLAVLSLPGLFPLGSAPGKDHARGCWSDFNAEYEVLAAFEVGLVLLALPTVLRVVRDRCRDDWNLSVAFRRIWWTYRRYLQRGSSPLCVATRSASWCCGCASGTIRIRAEPWLASRRPPR